MADLAPLITALVGAIVGGIVGITGAWAKLRSAQASADLSAVEAAERANGLMGKQLDRALNEIEKLNLKINHLERMVEHLTQQLAARTGSE